MLTLGDSKISGGVSFLFATETLAVFGAELKEAASASLSLCPFFPRSKRWIYYSFCCGGCQQGGHGQDIEKPGGKPPGFGLFS